MYIYRKNQKQADWVQERLEKLKNFILTLAPAINDAQRFTTEQKAEFLRVVAALEENERTREIEFKSLLRPPAQRHLAAQFW